MQCIFVKSMIGRNIDGKFSKVCDVFITENMSSKYSYLINQKLVFVGDHSICCLGHLHPKLFMKLQFMKLLSSPQARYD